MQISPSIVAKKGGWKAHINLKFHHRESGDLLQPMLKKKKVLKLLFGIAAFKVFLSHLFIPLGCGGVFREETFLGKFG